MNTKQKLELIRIGARERQLHGCRDLLGDNGRQLKAEVYADVIRRHPSSLDGRFYRVVNAINSMIGT